MSSDLSELSEVARNILLSLAILLGGIWAVWKWGFAEYLRRRSELLSFEGSLSAKLMKIQSGFVLVLLDAAWRNKSATDALINTKKTRVSFFPLSEIKSPLAPGALAEARFSSPEVSVYPYRPEISVAFEAGAESLVQTPVILRKHQVYWVKWVLHPERSHRLATRTTDGWWQKQMLLNTSANVFQAVDDQED